MVRGVSHLIALAALACLAAPTVWSDARFTAQTSNRANALSVDVTSRYLRAYSQSSNPTGLTGYATRRGSSPLVPAATGMDLGLTVNAGGYNNTNGTTANRVFTLTTPATLPNGVTSVTVALLLAADPVTGAQPISAATIATTANVAQGTTVSIGPGATRQVNLTIRTKNLTAGLQYIPKVVVQVTYSGFSGGFLSYLVPVKIYAGNGPGPN